MKYFLFIYIIAAMKNDREPINKFTPIGSIINKVLGTYRQESDEELAKVWSLWDSIVGEAIAKNARPAAFKEKLLLVHVTSPIWIQQLQFFKKDIITKLNHVLDKELIKDIKFKIGAFD